MNQLLNLSTYQLVSPRRHEGTKEHEAFINLSTPIPNSQLLLNQSTSFSVTIRIQKIALIILSDQLHRAFQKNAFPRVADKLHHINISAQWLLCKIIGAVPSISKLIGREIRFREQQLPPSRKDLKTLHEFYAFACWIEKIIVAIPIGTKGIGHMHFRI